MGPPPPSCSIGGCRFSRGYDPRVVLPAPAAARALPDVRAFATDALLGYPHLRSHFPWLSGDAVVEQLRLAWRPARLTVVRERKGALVWVVDHDALGETFDGERVKVVTKACSSYSSEREHCCPGCGEPRRPERMTLRSVQAWEPFGWQRVLHTDLEGVDVAEYLSDQPSSWIGMTFPIAGDPPWPNPRGGRFHFNVPIDTGERIVTARVVASRDDLALIEDDPAPFARDHDVVFTSRGPRGLLHAYFTRC